MNGMRLCGARFTREIRSAGGRGLIRPKLRTYALLKKELKMEPYLDDLTIRGGIPELTKLRGGANRLRIEQGRYVKERVEERLCLLCEEKKKSKTSTTFFSTAPFTIMKERNYGSKWRESQALRSVTLSAESSG